ncbi:MAG TPA: hypothetical protein VHG91_05845 [Longimicrobium sp.]|nr:hypothetical protein [Longimicrobium sp.]
MVQPPRRPPRETSALRAAADGLGMGAAVGGLLFGVWTLDLAWCLTLTAAGALAGMPITLAARRRESWPNVARAAVRAVAGAVAGAFTWLVMRPEVHPAVAVAIGAFTVGAIFLFEPQRVATAPPPPPPPPKRRGTGRPRRGRRGAGG